METAALKAVQTDRAAVTAVVLGVTAFFEGRRVHS
ncbi:hypothetical protein ACVMH6_001907 [Rhizobium leguminosarum]